MMVVTQICFLQFRNENDRKDYHIFFVPRRSVLCEKKLKVGFFTLIVSKQANFFPANKDKKKNKRRLGCNFIVLVSLYEDG